MSKTNFKVQELGNNKFRITLEVPLADKWYDAKDTEMVNKMVKETNGGFDVVIECCGNSPAVSSAIMAVRPGGVIVLVGVSLGTVTIPTVMAVMRELTLKGSIAYTKEEFETCIDLMANKKIDVKMFIDTTQKKH